MRKLRIYIDTSVYGGLHDEEFAEPTRAFFETVKDKGGVVLASQITIDELDGAPEMSVKRSRSVLPGPSKKSR